MTQQPVEVDPVRTLELAAADVVDNLVFPLGTPLDGGIGGGAVKRTFGVVRVGTDLSDLITEHGAVVHVRRAGGIQRSWQLVARLALDLYATSYTDAWEAQDAIEAVIGGRWRPNTQPGAGGIRIDSWRNESAATEQPYPGLSVLSSIWRVTTRHMPA